MKNTAKKSLLSVLALLLLLSSCGGEGGSTVPSDTEKTPDTEAPVKEDVYPYEIPDLGGDTFTILNCDDNIWLGMCNVIDYEEATGDIYEDAIFERARKAENDMNMTLEIVKDADPGKLTSMFRTAVMADEPTFDAVYTFLSWAGSTPLSGEYGINLYDIDTIHLEEPWWNQSFIRSATIAGDKLYASTDYNNMMGYAYANVLYFNKEMMRTLGLDMPYDVIGSGKWTYDVLNDYLKAAANLNGDTDFDIRAEGTCIYGFGAQHQEGPMCMLNGSGERFSSLDKDGLPVLTEKLDRFADAYDKLASILSEPGHLLMYNTADLSSKTVFIDQRILFWAASLGTSIGALRAADFEYGAIPFPKYEESQTKYNSMVSEYTLSLSIPKSAADSDRSGAVIDYMSYLGRRDVLPVLQTSLCYKGMRDEPSIQMMDIILDSLTTDIGYMFGWTMSLSKTLTEKIASGTMEFMSQYEKAKPQMESKIAASLEAMGLMQ